MYFFCFPGHLLHSSFPSGGFPSLLPAMTLRTSAQVQQHLIRGCCNEVQTQRTTIIANEI
ncbi:hypothetical protein LEMLEM_LOCUS19997 [Lemmus lemmus]